MTFIAVLKKRKKTSSMKCGNYKKMQIVINRICIICLCYRLFMRVESLIFVINTIRTCVKWLYNVESLKNVIILEKKTDGKSYKINNANPTIHRKVIFLNIVFVWENLADMQDIYLWWNTNSL